MTNTTPTVIEFMENLFIRDMQHALDSGLHYYVFPILCQAIEVLGALYDDKPLDEYGQSQKRFKKGLDRLFDDRRYYADNDLLYKQFRGNMIHQLRPGNGYALSSSTHNNMPRYRHLTALPDGTKILIIEVFFDDFKKAFLKLKSDIVASGSGIHIDKIKSPFFYYGPVAIPTTDAFSHKTGNDLTSTNAPSASGRP